jgi:pimeloyl-ACP methyl ester carboxylesterase
MHIVFLPATEPDNIRYGRVPKQIAGYSHASIYHVSYSRLVWYNQTVQDEAIRQICDWSTQPIILVGFSKSGLGAWNITLRMPERVVGTIIFDAPVARDSLPPWGTAPFYADDASWQQDLPLRNVAAFHEVMPDDHRLILISGTGFPDEMQTLSAALHEVGRQHSFLDVPRTPHRWDSGWIEKGLELLS